MLRQAAKSVLGSTAAVFDRAVTMAASAQGARRRRRDQAESLSHDQRMEALVYMRSVYDGIDDFFLPPSEIEPRRQRVRALSGGVAEDLRWGGDYQTYLPELADRYRSGGGAAAVRMWRHERPRPVLILVHGYLAGQHAVEERVWPSSWLYRRGLDLAFFVLPHHGIRGRGTRLAPPRFPGSDPRVTIEGFRHAMHELQSLVSYLYAKGHPKVGIMGMSLGGYTSSLAATVESRLHCAIPVIPLTSIADFARDQGRLGANSREQAQQHAALEAAYGIVSPLHRPSLLDSDRVLIVAANADRITPVEHARRLGRHFDAPVETWHGGHLLQFGRRDKFRRIGRFLKQSGMFEAP